MEKILKRRTGKQRNVRKAIRKWLLQSEPQVINGEALEIVCILGVAVARPRTGRHGYSTRNSKGTVRPVFKTIQAKSQG
jgi:hypothetical protein